MHLKYILLTLVYNLKDVMLTESSLTSELWISNVIVVSQKFVFLMYAGENLLMPWFLLVYRTIQLSEAKVLHGLKLLCGLWVLAKPFDMHVYKVIHKCERIIKLSTKGSVKVEQSFLLPSKSQRAV